MRAFKLARQILTKLQQMRIPSEYQDYVDLASLSIRAKPFHDNEDLLSMCYRCLTYNSPVVQTCITCNHKFIFSHLKFEILPLIEFQLEDNISDTEALKLIQNSYDESKPKESENTQKINTFILDEESQDQSVDPFTYKLMNFENKENTHQPIKVNKTILQSMSTTSIIVCKWPKPLKFKYYKNVLPGFLVTNCQNCFKMFHSDEYEVEVLRVGHCPFCRTKTGL